MDIAAQRAAIEELLGKLAAIVADDTGSDQPICTGWVLVAEWSTVDAEQFVSRYWHETMPPWHRDGLLHYALKNWKEGSE